TTLWIHGAAAPDGVEHIEIPRHRRGSGAPAAPPSRASRRRKASPSPCPLPLGGGEGGSRRPEDGQGAVGRADTAGRVVGGPAMLRRIGGDAPVLHVAAARSERAARGELAQSRRHPGNALEAVAPDRAADA